MINPKWLIICNLIFGAWRLSLCYAGDIKDSFYAANYFYEHADYDEAIKQYTGILETGVESGNLYYNLGNCYFKKRELGRAVLNYEKARRLIPWDRDLTSNYEYARSLVKNTAAVPRRNLAQMICGELYGRFTIDGLTILLSAFYILLLFCILIGMFYLSLKRYALAAALFAGLFLSAGFVGLSGKIARLNKEAIVIVEQTDAKFEPMDKVTTHFVLYEGMEVEVISDRNNWYKVRRSDNKSGWVENRALSVF